mgnify:CR=1 FL=1
MEFVKSLWEKEIIRKVFAFILIIFIVYFLRKVIDVFLLTFLFTYLIYNVQEFIINRLKPFIKTNQLFITITVYSMIFILLGYFIYKFVPIIISQSMSIINEFKDVKFKTNINQMEEYLFPLIGKFDIEGYMKNEANSIFQFIASIGKWGINILLSLILSLFFMIEKSRVEYFLKKFENQNDFSEQVFESLSSEEKYSFYNTIKKLCTHFEAQAILEDYDLSEPLPPHLREHIPPHERDGHHPKPPLHHHK